MSKFPEGKFTIVNNETGRTVRVRLGRTHDVSDWKEGTKYLQSVTEKPTLELGEADNTPATVWWHYTAEDAVKRRPFNQIVSHAVGEYQNIGNYCVWMDSDWSSQTANRFDTALAFENRLNDMPAEVRERLAPLIPSEWTTLRADQRAEQAEDLEFQKAEEARAGADAEMEAWAAEENPPNDQDLGLLRAQRLGDEDTLPAQWESERYYSLPEDEREEWLSNLTPEKQEALRSGFSERMWNAVMRLETDPRAEQVRERAGKLLPEIRERHTAAALAAIPQDDLEWWHLWCAHRKIQGSVIVFSGVTTGSSQHDRLIAALETYVEAAAKEGIVPPVIAADSTTRMYGSGASNGPSSTYGWTYDGTYIYAADSHTIPSEQTYWTDAGGYLVGRPKGGPGQTWSIVKWTPTPPTPNYTAVALTGLFGPLGALFGG
ncbi:hypothetical protein ABZ667_43150 [Streptomyces lavendulae]|uniref:hypothetical protein n=1 Tax=Streptomyces lavendulae TaxID=1914 RepID=UPI0033FF9B6B